MDLTRSVRVSLSASEEPEMVGHTDGRGDTGILSVRAVIRHISDSLCGEEPFLSPEILASLLNARFRGDRPGEGGTVAAVRRCALNLRRRLAHNPVELLCILPDPYLLAEPGGRVDTGHPLVRGAVAALVNGVCARNPLFSAEILEQCALSFLRGRQILSILPNLVYFIEDILERAGRAYSDLFAVRPAVSLAGIQREVARSILLEELEMLYPDFPSGLREKILPEVAMRAGFSGTVEFFCEQRLRMRYAALDNFYSTAG